MGVLYVVATPIGNLEDLTARAARVLASVPVVAAEDTRRTRKLLNHIGASPRLIPYHAESPERREDAIVACLREGDVALVSDAGTPGLADPGPDLVARVRREGMSVVPIPGASALATALSVVSFAQQPVTFIGFLPERRPRRERLVQRAAEVARTLVIYLPPHRAAARVAELLEWLGDRPTAMCRELTKLHEDIRELPLSELCEALAQEAPRGEITLVVDVAEREPKAAPEASKVANAVAAALASGASPSQAAASVARELRMPRREVYALAQEIRRADPAQESKSAWDRIANSPQAKSSVSKYYLTTAIPYPSGEPHVGHSFEMIAADAMVRFKRLRGVDAYFLGGLDENSQRVSRQAAEAGIDTMAYVDEAATLFQAVWRSVDVEFDDFVRTTEPRHHVTVNEFFARVLAQGDIYEGDYEGWYCVPCEAFYTDDDLADGLCPFHNAKPEWVTERNYFFRMSKYQDAIAAHYEAHPDFVYPDTRRNEMLGIIRQGLRDFSISRASLTWGIPLPNDPAQRIYVWFDALINYITGIGFGQNGGQAAFEQWWPAEAHVIGKDIVRFHALYWPTMLMSAGLPLPRQIVVHGWVDYEGAPMSQTSGHIVRPADVIERHGSDALRYYLLREVPFDRDGDFKWENMGRRYQDDLGNDLGNLVLRTTSMLGRYFDGVVPPADEPSEVESELRAAAETAWTLADAHYESWRLHLALGATFEFVSAVNRYIDRTEPWRLARDPAQRERLATVLGAALEAVRHIAIQIQPAMPRTSTAILDRLGLPPAGPGDWGAGGWTGLPAGHRVPGGAALFPRIEAA